MRFSLLAGGTYGSEAGDKSESAKRVPSLASDFCLPIGQAFRFRSCSFSVARFARIDPRRDRLLKLPAAASAARVFSVAGPTMASFAASSSASYLSSRLVEA